MTTTAAVMQLKDLKRDRESFFTGKGDEIYHYDAAACDIAVKVLEKQIPEKPVLSDKHAAYYAQYTCPSCGGAYLLGKGVANYCYHCGQALDWSDDNKTINSREII